MATDKEQQEAGDVSYLEGLSGDGTTDIGQSAVSTAYLSMIQPGSTAVTPTNLAGTWRNSATDENYGNTVEVIPVAFKTVWTERDKDPPFMTVGRYEVNTKEIQTRIEKPKPGKRGFPKMYNIDTGNEIQELFVYAVLLKDYPEAGVLYLSPTAGSMRACKQWNALLRSQRIPGTTLIAPIYAFSWNLKLEVVPNPARPTEEITKFVSVQRGTLVAKDLMNDRILPARTVAKSQAMLAAPEQSGDIEEE